VDTARTGFDHRVIPELTVTAFREIFSAVRNQKHGRSRRHRVKSLKFRPLPRLGIFSGTPLAGLEPRAQRHLRKRIAKRVRRERSPPTSREKIYVTQIAEPPVSTRASISAVGGGRRDQLQLRGKPDDAVGVASSGDASGSASDNGGGSFDSSGHRDS
jgi:hypothetical protein